MSRSDDDARRAPTCAVCYDDVDDASLARLPCCGARARVDDAVLREMRRDFDSDGGRRRRVSAVSRGDRARRWGVRRGAASAVRGVPAGEGDGRDVRGVRARRTRGAAISLRAVRRRAAHTAPDVAVHGVADVLVERDVGVSRGVRGLHAVEDRFAGRGERAGERRAGELGIERGVARRGAGGGRTRAGERGAVRGGADDARGGWGEGGGDGGAVGGGGGDDGVRRRTVR